MARKVTISKEIILEAGLRMLIREGYAAVNIKSLAKEIGCSTQPIAWHFENMEGLRRALAEYAGEYARKEAASDNPDAAEAFRHMGSSYIRMAIREPNLFRFLYIGGSPLSKPYETADISGRSDDSGMVSGIAEQTGLSKEQAAVCIRNTVIYSHGLAVMLATGVLKASEDEAMAMINDASESFVIRERMRENG